MAGRKWWRKREQDRQTISANMAAFRALHALATDDYDTWDAVARGELRRDTCLYFLGGLGANFVLFLELTEKKEEFVEYLEHAMVDLTFEKEEA